MNSLNAEMPPPLPKKRIPFWQWAVLVVLVLFLAGTVGTFVTEIGRSNDEVAQEVAPTITYRVSGTARSKITYTNETNGTSQARYSGNHNEPHVYGPGKHTWVEPSPSEWTETVHLRPGEVAYLTAQSDEESGTVIVELVSHGVVLKRSESHGEYCIATVSGRV